MTQVIVGSLLELNCQTKWLLEPGPPYSFALAITTTTTNTIIFIFFIIYYGKFKWHSVVHYSAVHFFFIFFYPSFIFTGSLNTIWSCSQLTKLKDGLAIGCALNHAILDGTSTWHFMSSWAEICRGATSTWALPFLDRTRARNARRKLDLPSPSAPPTASNGYAKPDPPLREKIFRFSESAIDQIKSTVNENRPSDGSKPFSTFQALSVHIWRHVSHARNLKPEDYTVFTVFVDCRKRVDPPMPESYFGNLIQAVFTVTAAGLLAAHPPQFAASLIQKAIEAHDAKATDDRNKEWESAPKIFQFKDAGVNCVAVGSSPRFKVYEVDFGWGKPEKVRSGSNNKFDGMICLYPGKSGGRSIDVELTLEAEAMGRLEHDKEFLVEV